MFNKVSEFLYKSHEVILGFAIKKESFMQIIEDHIGKRMIGNIKTGYQRNIRDVVHQHREITARKFQSRVDYVDLSAFGVNYNFDDVDRFAEGSKQIAEEIDKYSNKYGRLIHRLTYLDRKLHYYQYCLSAMTDRYDERMKNIIMSE